MTDPVRGYDEGAAALAALDIGSGSGRDAAWLCRLGFEVVAVEPARRMREAAQALRASQAIRWLDDRLPTLSATHRLGLAFDVILLRGVLMHVAADERPRAFHNQPPHPFAGTSAPRAALNPGGRGRTASVAAPLHALRGRRTPQHRAAVLPTGSRFGDEIERRLLGARPLLVG